MYKIKNSDKNAIIVTSNGETVIPVSNILFATSSPFTVEEKEIPVTEWIEGMKKAGYLD